MTPLPQPQHSNSTNLEHSNSTNLEHSKSTNLEHSKSTNLSKLLIDLLLERPFFGVPLAQTVLMEDLNIPTACTDGQSIRFNPVWLAELNEYESIGLMTHEVLHIIFKHHLRRNGRDPRLWNIACDMAINPLLVEAGFVLPAGGLSDTFSPPRSAEEIYEDIKHQLLESPLWGEVSDFPGDIEKEEHRVVLMTADALRRSEGKLPGGLDRAVRKQVTPEIPWYLLLRDYIVTTIKENYSSVQFSKRYIKDNIYLPALASKKLNLVVVVDTSGSVDDKQLSEMVGVIEDIRAEIPTTVWVIGCDAAVTSETCYDEQDPLEIHLKGGGGTDYRPAFDYVNKKGIEPNVLLYLTDGYCNSYPDRESIDFPVIWIYMTNNIELDVW